MRHRAGIGMSENSDAVVVLVSEETGSISVAVGGMLKRHLMTETLEQLLRNELLPQPEESPGPGSGLRFCSGGAYTPPPAPGPPGRSPRRRAWAPSQRRCSLRAPRTPPRPAWCRCGASRPAVLDILVIAYLVYRLLLLVRRTNTSRLLKGVLVVII